MSVEIRLIVVSLAAFVVVSVVTAALVPLVVRRLAAGAPARRASRLAALRLFPTAAATAAGLLVALSFFVFEPRSEDEYMGRAMPALAALAVLLFGAALWRGFRLITETRRMVDGWLRTAEPIALAGINAPAFVIDWDFPIVAVVGLRRPRLIISRAVLASCAEDELRAVLAHEQGHIDRRDNLRRLLLSVAPDILAWLPASHRITVAWCEAIEDAADDDSANAGRDGRVRLASALVKVARLAPANSLPMVPASALYRGENLDRRVRRLVAPEAPRGSSPANRWPLHLAGAAVAVLGLTALEQIHAIVEVLIHTLP